MIVYIDMDDVLCKFTEAYKKSQELNPLIKFPQSQYGFFSGLAPMEGSIEAALALLNSNCYEPYILTAPSIKNPLCYTEKRVWVEKWLGYAFVDKLIICPNKSLLKGDLLIDDNLSGKGQENFEGKVLHFGSEDYPDWFTISRTLSLLAP